MNTALAGVRHLYESGKPILLTCVGEASKRTNHIAWNWMIFSAMINSVSWSRYCKITFGPLGERLGR